MDVGLIILDECHHLMGHWGRVLADARELLGDPHVIGLTATPPDRSGKKAEDIERYDEFFGEIDFEVPVPAVVKDGFLAPYQDLAFFVRPSAEELEFVATTDRQLDELLDELCQLHPDEAELEQETTDEHEATSEEELKTDPPLETSTQETEDEDPVPSEIEDDDDDESTMTDPARSADEEAMDHAPSLTHWLYNSLQEKKLARKKLKSWFSFERRDEVFANAARMFLQKRNIKLPEDVPPLDAELVSRDTTMDDLIPLLDRYVRHALRRSNAEKDHALAEQAVQRLRMLGVQITETGAQACASPVGRVLAYSKNKARAVPEILRHEIKALGNSIRAVIVTDFEKSSATEAQVGEILDAESGGAIAVFSNAG